MLNFYETGLVHKHLNQYLAADDLVFKSTKHWLPIELQIYV